MGQINPNDMQIIITRIDQKFEDFKETVVDRLDKIDKKYDEKCNTCVNAPKFRERLKSQWTHITGIWAVIGTYAAYLLTKR